MLTFDQSLGALFATPRAKELICDKVIGINGMPSAERTKISERISGGRMLIEDMSPSAMGDSRSASSGSSCSSVVGSFGESAASISAQRRAVLRCKLK